MLFRSDVLLGLLGVEEQELRDHDVRDVVVDRRPEDDDAVLEQTGEDVPATLAAGTKGKRYALPHSRVMIHQPLAGFQGQATDIEIHTKEILKTRDTLNDLYSKHTGQPVDKIKVDTDRDNFMSSSQAKEYGLIDEVLVTAKKKPDEKSDKK